MHVSKLHELCTDLCCIADELNSPKAYSNRFVLGLACETTFCSLAGQNLSACCSLSSYNLVKIYF